MNKEQNSKKQSVLSKLLGIVSQAMEKIRDELFLFVIAVAALIIVFVVSGTTLVSSNDLRFTISVIAFLAFIVILVHFLTRLRLGDKSNEQDTKPSQPTVNLPKPQGIGHPKRDKVGILVDLSHKQNEWNSSRMIFQLSSDSHLLSFIHQGEEFPWDIRGMEKKYLFSWDEISGNDNGILIDFLKRNYSIDSAKVTKVEINDDGRTIKVFFENNCLSLNLNDEKTNVNIKINDVKIDEFNARTENGKLNIYEKKSPFFSEDFASWKGLIFGIPHNIDISHEVCNAIVKWVRGGGRLIILGYELGPRHHKTNLNTLAERFGIRFNTDIVVKSKSDRSSLIQFNNINSAHQILSGVNNLFMKKLCTLTIEPGAEKILTVGKNNISSLKNPKYNDKGYIYETIESKKENGYKLLDEPISNVPWIPIIAEAPKGLVGKGSVLAIGTWDFFRDEQQFKDANNYIFINNLLNWLANQS